MNGFLGPLRVDYIDGCRWLVTEPFVYHLAQADGLEFVRVDVGEITDFASIPRLLQLRWRSPGGPWDKPAVIHDQAYACPFVQHKDGSARRIDRGEADRIFYEAMGVTKTGGITRRLLYAGVRTGGWVVWRKYRQAEAGDRQSA
mgnify:FL=1